jgi:anti-sigma B factor antagonist
MHELLAPDRPFELLVTWSVRGTAISVRGELDIDAAPALRATLRRACDHGGPVSLDLSAVTFIDAAGLRVLAEARSSSDADRPAVTLTAPSRCVRRLLSLAGLGWSVGSTSDRWRRPGGAVRGARAPRTIVVTRHGRPRPCPPAGGHVHVWRKGYYLGQTAEWACMLCGRAAPRLVPSATAAADVGPRPGASGPVRLLSR